jgi:hypothetical protein
VGWGVEASCFNTKITKITQGQRRGEVLRVVLMAASRPSIQITELTG